MGSPLRPFALAALLLLVATAPAADMGVPRDGFDRVLLDDGRVIDARVLPREKDLVPLEFATRTLRVDRSRVREVRYWRDFDPAPRDDAEKEKAEKGFLRWKGTLVPAAYAQKQREKEIADEAEARRKEAEALSWKNAVEKTAGPIRITSNAPKEVLEEWSRLLGALGDKMKVSFPGTWTAASVHVHIYRDQASFDEQKADDNRYGRIPDPTSPWDPSRRIWVILGNSRMEDLSPQVLRLVSLRMFQELMGHRLEEMGGWVQFGVPTYFAASSFERGQLKVGLVDDLFLLLYREMEQEGRLPSMDAILSAGNRYWNEAYSRDASRALRGRLEVDHLPFAWMLVNTILEAEDGKYRGGLTNWVKFWFNAKVGPLVEASGDFEQTRKRLLQYLKLKDFGPLLDSMRNHAAGMEYRTPAPLIYLANRMLKDHGSPEGALRLLQPAVRLAGTDAPRLREVAEAYAAVPGGEDHAREVLRLAVEADPLDAAARAAFAKLLSGDEAAAEASLAEALGAGAPAPAVGK